MLDKDKQIELDEFLKKNLLARKLIRELLTYDTGFLYTDTGVCIKDETMEVFIGVSTDFQEEVIVPEKFLFKEEERKKAADILKEMVERGFLEAQPFRKGIVRDITLFAFPGEWKERREGTVLEMDFDTRKEVGVNYSYIEYMEQKAIKA